METPTGCATLDCAAKIGEEIAGLRLPICVIAPKGLLVMQRHHFADLFNDCEIVRRFQERLSRRFRSALPVWTNKIETDGLNRRTNFISAQIVSSEGRCDQTVRVEAVQVTRRFVNGGVLGSRPRGGPG